MSERLPYHQNCANETRRANVFDVGEMRLYADRGVAARAAKPRNVRRNWYQSKGKNVGIYQTIYFVAERESAQSSE